MAIHLTVFAKDASAEGVWVDSFQRVIAALFDARVNAASAGGELGQVLFFDEAIPDLETALTRVDRKGRAVVLLTRDADHVPAVLTAGLVDDVLVQPLRAVEILGKISRYQQILMWDEVQTLNSSFSELLARLQEDLMLAERIQKAKLPLRFPDVKGFRVTSRYLAGVKSGGDYVDLADSRDGSWMSVILSDSSSYGLSSAVLQVLMRVAVKLTSQEMRSSVDTVRRIQDEIMLTLNVKDHLSLFYATLSRKDYILRYLNLGSGSAFYAPPGKPYEMLKVHGLPLTRNTGRLEVKEAEVEIQPGGRLALLSDGFLEIAGGAAKARELLDQFREKEPVDALNEFTFKVKSTLVAEDDMPAHDCTGIFLEMDSKVLRFAR